jgi:ANTAR domain
VDGDSCDSPAGVARRLEAARQEFDTQTQRFEAAKSRLQATVDTITMSRPRRELVYQSRVARLQARLETMPVVEQAKGILMAQQRCGPDEAFDLLRRASQRGNIKLHVLAAQLVARFTAPAANGDVKPYSVTNSTHV